MPMLLSHCSIDSLCRFSHAAARNSRVRRLCPLLQYLRNFCAHYLFDEWSYRDIHTLNAVLASRVRNRDASAAWDLFHQLHCKSRGLNAYALTPVLSACSALPEAERGRQVHALTIKTGADSEITRTALMGFYSKHGLLDDSVRVFGEMGFRDAVAWNALLSNFLRHGLPAAALNAFGAMGKEGVEFSEFTLCNVLKACTSLRAFPQGKQVHGLVVTVGRDLVVLGTALIDFYSNVGHVDEAVKVFSQLNCRKDDTIMLNALISGCLRNRKHGIAYSILSEMRPNKVVLTSSLAACSESSDLWVGKQAHCAATRLGLTEDTLLCNALLDMYAKCGELRTARRVFENVPVPHRDVVSWTSMIDAYGRHGHGVEALGLFAEMGRRKSAVTPNPVTFLAVLSACAHAGLVEQGRECFTSIPMKYGVEPGPAHYGCFMDILGRAGLIQEVWSVFDDMVKRGCKPSATVWGALLNACMLNQDLSGGELAAEHLLKLETRKTGHYVLLSNFYAAIGRWDVVDSLRSMVKKNGLEKDAGSSWVTVSGGRETSPNNQFHRNVDIADCG